jgi:hypothetical protein
MLAISDDILMILPGFAFCKGGRKALQAMNGP